MAGFGCFGAKTTANATPAAGGFAFASPATQGTTLLGSTPATQATGGFNFGTPAAGLGAAPATATPGFNFGTPAATTTAFNLATSATKSTAVPGFSLGGSLGTTPTAGVAPLGVVKPTTTATPGFGLAGTATTGALGTNLGLGLGGTPATATTSLGGLLATPATTATAAGIGAGTPTAGFNFAKPLNAAATTPATTLTLGKPVAAATGLAGFGTKLGTSTASVGFAGLGGLGGTTGATGGSIFGTAAPKTTSTGLGGVDPKTTTTTPGTTSDGTKTSEGKTVKETQVVNDILLHVDAFQKFVKEEKGETEHIKRMSSTPMIKVQEDNAALRQLLSVVASGLQRNVCAVDKLKKEMTQELKNAEMALRTKDIPAGLQYDNTAPTLYFQSLVENFENQMLSYRQQIEMLENHLSSLHQPNRLTAEELVLLLRKLHEAFIAMAAQLQQVHEAVKTQKDHYLNYRRVFLGDSRNIFERQKKAPVKVTPVQRTEPYGQSPFPGINNAAAVAMASALNRSQQPQPQGGAPPVTGFSNFPQPAGLGLGAGTGTTGLAGFGPTQTTGFKGFGPTPTAAAGGASLFGNTSNLATTQAAGTLFNSTIPVAGVQPLGSTPIAGTEQPFQLSKPPIGSKRGKR